MSLEWRWKNGHVREVRFCQFNGGRMVNVMEVASLMEGEWSFYIDRKFNGWRMVMLWRWAVLC